MEVGFWDYSCPQSGTIEHYSEQDYVKLFDDMKRAGMDSFVLCVKWLTTGYYSKLSFLDQDGSVTAIASKNAVLKFALKEARARGIKTRLLVVCNIFNPQKFILPKLWMSKPSEDMPNVTYNTCDIDLPGLKEITYQMLDEILGEFGELSDGLIVEIEFCDRAEAHRIPIYNAWAKANDRPLFDEICKIDIQPRAYPFMHWRDFATERRIIFLNDVKDYLRNKGYRGELSTIYEIWNDKQVIAGGNNLDMLYEGIGKDFDLVTYDGYYTRKLNHDSSIEFCIKEPMHLGFKTFYITRGVMTFANARFDSLEEQWDMSLSDAVNSGVNGLWFMGADCTYGGSACILEYLQKRGFESGIAARDELLRKVAATLGK